jgi:hypothetical protein
MAVQPDFLIGLHASQLVRDGGTLQLGIGSLGDAVSFFTTVRHWTTTATDIPEAAGGGERCPAGLRELWVATAI